MRGALDCARRPGHRRFISREVFMTARLAQRGIIAGTAGWLGRDWRWSLGGAALLGLLLLPIATTLVLALRPSNGALGHLAATVLPAALRDTLLLMLGTGVMTIAIGTITAWLVTMYRFPGKAVLDRLLVLPLAMPTYILAYVYVDLLDFAGPVQTGLRGLFGWTTARDYLFPDIRSLSGAIFVLSMALYPYVYLSARASFVQQSICVLEVARTLGRTSTGAFFSVALPLARPALVAGGALVLMECMNEFGAMQYLGVSTLTVSIYATWLERSSLPGAAQLAVAALCLVAGLAWVERTARAGAKFHNTTGRFRAIPFQDLYGGRAIAAIAVCAAPGLIGFVLPFLVLLYDALKHLGDALALGFWLAAWRSVSLSALAAVAAVAVGLVLAYARRINRTGLVATAALAASLGYALPGTVLALGLKLPLATFDNGLDGLMRATTGWSTGLLISGSILILVLAYVIRFLAVSLGALEAGLERLSPNLDAAARALGETATSALKRVHLPLIVPALGTAGLLVFVDAMKELPATLLLRPFNFDTLATQVYAQAAAEKFEAAALGALAIVLVGLLPVLLLHRAVAGGRAGHGR
jgi:iron(III) transport system permease protein